MVANRVLVVCVLAGMVAGCPSEGAAPDARPCDLAVEWGPRRAPDFAPFRDGDTAEITLGFQGFRYISSSVLVSGASEREGVMWFQIDLPAQELQVVQQHVAIPEGEGARYVDDVLVFFNDTPIAELVGRTAAITARLSSGGCEATHAAHVILADDEGCVEQPDGSLVCE